MIGFIVQNDFHTIAVHTLFLIETTLDSLLLACFLSTFLGSFLTKVNKIVLAVAFIEPAANSSCEHFIKIKKKCSCV